MGETQLSPKRTRQAGRSNSDCSIDESANGFSATTTNNHKRSRLDLNNITENSFSGSNSSSGTNGSTHGTSSNNDSSPFDYDYDYVPPEAGLDHNFEDAIGRLHRYADDRSEDYEDIEVYDDEIGLNDEIEYMSGSEESSGYQDYHGVMGHPDYDVDDESFDPDTDDEEDEVNQCLPDEYLKYDPTPDAPYPKPEWTTVKELRARKCGFSSTRTLSRRRPNMQWFERYASNSLWMIQRLQLEKKLQAHNECINCLDFNSSGSLLCSGSDDLTVCIWNWQLTGNQLKKKITTGHASNVFQSQFCQSDSSIITSARDGSVRLIDIETGLSDLLLSQSGEIGNLAFITPQTLVTCGTNAGVNFIDLRSRETKKLFVVRSPKNNRTCPLHSINSHPLDSHKIVVAGSSPYVFLYDLRRISRSSFEIEPKPTYCLGEFKNTGHMVTSTAFNSTGDKLLMSYNDDDLYVSRTDTCEIIHKYQGHRNKKTIKGCAWFGDNFVLSGSDDGHIYGWDLESQHIVCFLEGDSSVVNCLCVHPELAILASSGFDHDVKIWEPVSGTWPQTLKGIKPQICKNTMRRKRAYERRIRPQDDGGSDTDL